MNRTSPWFFSSTAIRLAALLSLPAGFSPVFGQASPPVETTSPGETPVVLSAFEVRSGDLGRYQTADATSGGRMAQELFASPQTVNVATSQLLADVGADRILDALIFTPSVTESTIPNGLDRITVRGFQVEGETVDGFYIDETQQNIDPALLDRIEVVLGPNAILAPTGSPGGTINNLTKKPLFQAQSSLSLQAGLFDYGGAVLDTTGPFSDKFAYRLIADVHSLLTATTMAPSRSPYTVAPALTYQMTRGTKLTVQGLFDYAHFTNYLGIPVDPSSGSTNDAMTCRGAATAGLYNDSDVYREQNEKSVSAFFAISGSLTPFRCGWRPAT